MKWHEIKCTEQQSVPMFSGGDLSMLAGRVLQNLGRSQHTEALLQLSVCSAQASVLAYTCRLVLVIQQSFRVPEVTLFAGL